jgi:hypothetical protein
MAMTINGTSGITFNDATTQSTAAGTTTPISYAIGAYVVAGKTTGGTVNTTANETIAGSNLRFGAGASSGTANANHVLAVQAAVPDVSTFIYNPNLAGTWRAMSLAGNGTSTYNDSRYYPTALWLRIS